MGTSTITMEVVREIVADIIKRRFKVAGLGGQQYAEAFISFLVYCSIDLRFHAIASRKDIEDIWNKHIRVWDVRVDLLMGMTRELQSRVAGFDNLGVKGDTQTSWNLLIETLAQAMSVYWNDQNDKYTVADVELTGRTLSGRDWELYLNANPWLVTMLLIEQIQITESELDVVIHRDNNRRPLPTPGQG